MNGFPLLAGLILTVAVGCASLTTVNPRAMTVNDVAAMTSAGVGADVIKRQIEATRSQFKLSAEEIILLKRAGVADDVLTAMIDSGDRRYSDNYGYGLSSYNVFDPRYPGYFGAYGNPYALYQNPGLIGRFYSYYPLSRGGGYWNDPYRDNNPYNNDHNPVNPGTGDPGIPDRGPQPRPERRK